MKLKEFLESNNIPFREDVSLSYLTGMNLKGRLPLVAKPESIETLSLLYRYLITTDVSFEVVGGLSNTYLSEFFTRDILIQTTHVLDIHETDETIVVGCGYNLTKLSKYLSGKGVTGYEGFIGIPGTVGAAAINNSSALGSAMEDVVKEVHCIDKNGKTILLHHDELNYKVRHSILKGEDFGVLTKVVLDISRKDSQKAIDERISKLIAYRKKNIDGKRKSLGSVIVGPTLPCLWDNHRIALFLRRVLYAPFKYTPLKKKADCFLDFLVLGKPSLAKHCDNLGRFCWSKETTENDFFGYINFLRKVSDDKIKLEIEIKK